MKTLTILAAALTIACTEKKSNQTETLTTEKTTDDSMKNSKTIYDFKVEDIEGNIFDLASLKGKKVLIVNTASQCGLTPQFEQLQSLYTEFKDKNFVIVGFPTNDFKDQDPGSNHEIATFCQKNYGVTFPMMSKIKVLGDDIHPLYQYLTKKSENGIDDFEIQWNFQKFLINEQGQLEKVFGPRTLPTDNEIKDWIKA